MCACVSTRWSTDEGGTGDGSQFRWRSGLEPWKSPQSTRKRVAPVSTRNREPVTVPAAPRNRIEGIRCRPSRLEKQNHGDGKVSGNDGCLSRRWRRLGRRHSVWQIQSVLPEVEHPLVEPQDPLARDAFGGRDERGEAIVEGRPIAGRDPRQ